MTGLVCLRNAIFWCGGLLGFARGGQRLETDRYVLVERIDSWLRGLVIDFARRREICKHRKAFESALYSPTNILKSTPDTGVLAGSGTPLRANSGKWYQTTSPQTFFDLQGLADEGDA